MSWSGWRLAAEIGPAVKSAVWAFLADVARAIAVSIMVFMRIYWPDWTSIGAPAKRSPSFCRFASFEQPESQPLLFV